MTSAFVEICVDPRINHELMRIQVPLERGQVYALRAAPIPSGEFVT